MSKDASKTEIKGQFSYSNSTEEILTELINSKINNNVIAISALSFGPRMIMTAVEDIMDIKKDKIILLKETDLLGTPLPESEILLSEIVRVHAFTTKYDDPFHIQLREHKRERE
jgi:hypothetical protein